MKNNTSTVQVSSTQLREAAELQEQIEKLTGQVAVLETEYNAQRTALNTELDGYTTKYNAILGIVAGEKSGTGTGRTFSAEVRAKISAGQKAKWAERRAAKALLAQGGSPAPSETPAAPATTEQPAS